MKKVKITDYILILTLISVIFFSNLVMFESLDKKYFKEHKQKLTTTETIEMPDGSIVTNYYYSNTPYSIIYKISFWLYTIIPALTTIFLSGRYLLRTKNFIKSLIMPLFFVVITYLEVTGGAFNIVGGEAFLGLILMGIYLSITLTANLITNIIIYSTKLR